MGVLKWVGWWLLIGVGLLTVLHVLRRLRDAMAVDLVFTEEADVAEGGKRIMAEIQELAMEVGATKKVKVTGRGKNAQARPIESVEALVAQNPERYTVTVEGDVLTVVSAKFPTDEPVTNPETGEITGGLGEADASLQGALDVGADVKIGEGVKALRETLAIRGYLPEATDLVFEEVEDAARSHRRHASE